ncbi:hypothetical protein SD71_10795 [Cohnella kolymensis]|uniref:Uncharacterized protein n=1 Tax=Cohnella kolymensis TaxID=1590652 RepID=A0ABR5A4E5_9BACL|nr:hypothetical protein [Cohnella kolymensis]KIL35870.1 hypothetical protein SD71_10795 [Cohnella kolymensis]
MATGDRTPTEITPPTALSTTATAVYTNSAANRGQLTGLWICNTSSFQRIVTLYKNGTAAVNQISAITLPAGTSTLIDLSGKALVFTGTQILAAKQDAGTDCNIAAYGILEQIA